MKPSWHQVMDVRRLRAGVVSKIPQKGPKRAAILGAIKGALRGALVLSPDNFTPPSRTPWGGEKSGR